MISVIIPTYNRASFLREAINSVFEQDYFCNSNFQHSWEILIIDDGSTDDTRETVESFGSNVRYHYKEHKGVSSSRNMGIELAAGDYIAFLDSDDLWEKEKISCQMNFLKTFPEAVVCYTEETWIRRGVHVNPRKKHRKYSGWLFEKVLPLCLISLSSALFRRVVFDEIGNFDEELSVCEDYDFGIRLAHRYPVYLLSRPLIIKRGGHEDQLSKKYWGMDRFRVKALEKALSLDLTRAQQILVKLELVKKCDILARGFAKRNNNNESKRYFAMCEKYKL